MPVIIAASLAFCSTSKNQLHKQADAGKEIKTGADQTEKYLPYLKGKRVAILANLTSIIGKTHLVDSLKTLGVNIVKVFGPEHGFRGNASAGVQVADETDAATGIPVISLYGTKNKPGKEDLANVDIVIYDLQDVGCRFYTNINSLARLMDWAVDRFIKLTQAISKIKRAINLMVLINCFEIDLPKKLPDSLS